MAKWFPAVDDREGAIRATKAGFYGAIGFSIIIAIGFLVVFFGGTLAGEASWTGSARISGLAGIMVELVIALAAAWQFWQGKGLVIGSIALLLFVAEMVEKIRVAAGVGASIVLYLAIFAGLINGLRGAWALRKLGEDPADLEEIFR